MHLSLVHHHERGSRHVLHPDGQQHATDSVLISGLSACVLARKPDTKKIHCPAQRAPHSDVTAVPSS